MSRSNWNSSAAFWSADIKVPLQLSEFPFERHEVMHITV